MSAETGAENRHPLNLTEYHMIEGRTLPPVIYCPPQIKVELKAAQKAIRTDLAHEFEPLMTLDFSQVNDSDYPADRSPEVLRKAWKDMRAQMESAFADELKQHPGLSDALKNLDKNGAIGRYVERQIKNYEDGNLNKQHSISILNAFNSLFGACASCKDAQLKIDALGAALNLPTGELKCSAGTVERLEEIIHGLKPANFLVTSTFFSTRDRFRAERGITDVHQTNALTVNTGVITASSRMNGDGKILMHRVVHDLEREIHDLLRDQVPQLMMGLHDLFARPGCPEPKEINDLQDKHPLAWAAIFPSNLKLLQDTGTYLNWNDYADGVESLNWNNVLTNLANNVFPLLNGETVASILVNNPWAHPLLEDQALMFRTLTTSASSFIAMANAFPDRIDDWIALTDPANPEKGDTCLNRLANEGHIAELLLARHPAGNRPLVDVEWVFKNNTKHRDAFRSMAMANDQRGLTAVYLCCLHNGEAKNKNAMSIFTRRHFPALINPLAVSNREALYEAVRAANSTLPANLFRHCVNVADRGDPERAYLLIRLASDTPIDKTHMETHRDNYDRLTVDQLKALHKTMSDTGHLMDSGWHGATRMCRFVEAEMTGTARLLHYSPAQIEATARAVGLNDACADFVRRDPVTWAGMSAEIMETYADMLRAAPGTKHSGLAFLNRYETAFRGLITEQKAETAKASAAAPKFLHQYAEKWMQLDLAEMHWTRCALENGLLGKLGGTMFDEHTHYKLINPQLKWFKLNAAQMMQMTRAHAADPGTGKKLMVEHYSLIRKFDDLQILMTANMLKAPGGREWLDRHFWEWKKLDAAAMQKTTNMLKMPGGREWLDHHFGEWKKLDAAAMQKALDKFKVTSGKRPEVA
jgi:hypothetical protein